jgi:hypothetical protein
MAEKWKKSNEHRRVMKDAKSANGFEYKGKNKTRPPGERSRRNGLATV